MALQLEKIELRLPIEVIDIDIFPDVAVEYGIRSVPTLVMVEDGAIIKKITGLKTPQELKEWISHD
jgi:thioredoxin 1